jgi:hypothetical protein
MKSPISMKCYFILLHLGHVDHIAFELAADFKASGGRRQGRFLSYWG